MSSGTYAHIRDELLDYYASKGCIVKIDPPGRGAPDILGQRSDGSILVGEIKSATEATGSASSWWSYWTKPERDLRPHYRQQPPTTPSAVKGWCAVIDGQLREYCERHSTMKGDLVVEDGAFQRNNVDLALTFLESEGRIRPSPYIIHREIGFWTIEFR